MKKALLFFCLLVFTFSANSQIDSLCANKLQEALDISVVQDGNHGVSAFLIMPNGTSWSGTSGVGANEVAISDSTLFNAASITKLNISVLMLLLAEDNLLHLDSSWTNYISLDANFDHSITLRQLLNHTSGLQDYLESYGSYEYITEDFNRFFEPRYILETIVNDIPDFPPGSGFDYSNSNYVLATMIIEKVTGNPVQVELRARLWEPLGMDHTYFGGYENYNEPSAGIWFDFGAGITDYSDESTTSMHSYAYGAGNLMSCPRDLALLLDELIKGNILSTQSMNEMLTFVPQSFYTWVAGYGLGIHHQYGQTDDVVLGHDGYYMNLADLFHSSTYGFTLVSMTNTESNWFAIFNDLYNILVDELSTTEKADNNSNNNIQLFPNPSRKRVCITAESEIDELKIFDLRGQLIDHSFPGSRVVTKHILGKGIYIIRVKSNQSISTKKLYLTD